MDNVDRFKFRVWDKKEKKYRNPRNYRIALTTDGTLITLNGDGSNTELDVDDCIIEQCAGLKDKNGKLIFENDKIKVDNSIGIVESGLSFYVNFNNSFDQELNEIANSYNGRYEIIGNIHDEATNER